ncbi:hypothetical protein [Candidatus Palauibacter sp.]|uniref:hypothetical protein n=1 Tax=Candidatus Palauibacter sp. TaxID=3101350 RepID=UPI003CC60499
MYQTCMFCKKPLGSNEVVESFPVGRRLAFDAAKGRLWVVCRKCLRWNLTPLEERWEAVETCERLFRATPLRASTDHVGLARHREGLELVRIGKPPRGEFAAWRYGDQFRRRMRNVGFTLAGGFAANLVFANLPGALVIGGTWVVLAWSTIRTAAKVRVEGEGTTGEAPVEPGTVVKFKHTNIRSIRMLPAEHEPGFTVDIRQGIEGIQRMRTASFAGEDARRVAAAVLPVLNANGGMRRTVQAAVAEIEAQGHPSRYVAQAVRGNPDVDRESPPGLVTNMRKPTRLALEMALHEEQERRALEGELWVLEQAWREAEEIAAIADKLLLPAGTDAFFERYGATPGSDRR